MPVLAGWLTGEQVSPEIIEQTISAMGDVLQRHGGQPTQTILPGAGLIACADPTYEMRHNDEPPVLDWVPDRRTLVYRRPLSGHHPLYYIENWPAEGNLLFASEIKALFVVGVPRKLHAAALQALTQYGFIPAPWTIFQNISIVPAGSILRWQRSKTVLNHSTDYRFNATEKTDSTTLEQFFTHLQKASTYMLPPHDQLVALTNGTSASTLSTLLAAQQHPSPFTIAAIDYTKEETEESWRYVEEVAEITASPLLTVQGVDQPEFWIATLTGIETPCITTRLLSLHQLLHTTAIETEARVAITALGANALFGSPSIFKNNIDTTSSGTALDMYKQTIRPPLSEELRASLWSPDFAQILQTAEPWEETLHARKLARQASLLTDQKLAQYYLDLHLRLPDQLVMPMQQLATQEQIALRSPYLHHRSIELLTQLPQILHDEIHKDTLPEYFLRHHLQYQAPLASTPTQIISTASLRDLATSDLLQATLSPEALQNWGIFNPQTIATLLQQPENPAANSALVLVFTTQLLCQLFQVER